MPRYLTAVSTAALIGAFTAAVSAQTMPKDPGAAANVRQSQQYEQVLHSNPSFRAKRLQQECGPITDPQLHSQCVASFNGGAGAGGASPAQH